MNKKIVKDKKRRGIVLMALTIDEIRKLVKEGKIQWRGHMLHRMKQRGINISDVLECIRHGEE